jgi:hypothetical protein
MTEQRWFHITLVLKSGDTERIRVCNPHDPDEAWDSVEAQKAALDLAEVLTDPDGSLISGVSTSGHYLVIPDHEIAYIRVGGNAYPWEPSQLSTEVFAPDPDKDNGHAKIIQLKDIRLHHEDL